MRKRSLAKVNYYRVFFSFEGRRWWHDIWASDAARVRAAALKQGYSDVVVYQHEGVQGERN